MYLIKIFILVLILSQYIFSQGSINFSSKDVISLDTGFSLLYDFDKPFFEVDYDSVSKKSQNISFGNSLGLTSDELTLGYVWGQDHGHSGFDYNWIYILYGYNFWEIIDTKKGYYWGAGIRKSAVVFVIKIEYQKLIKTNSDLFLIELGLGL